MPLRPWPRTGEWKLQPVAQLSRLILRSQESPHFRRGGTVGLHSVLELRLEGLLLAELVLQALVEVLADRERPSAEVLYMSLRFSVSCT